MSVLSEALESGRSIQGDRRAGLEVSKEGEVEFCNSISFLIDAIALRAWLGYCGANQR